IAIAVTDMSRVSPDTNIYVGVAEARICERTTIFTIDGRPSVLGLFFDLRIERLELDVSSSGHCARRKRRLKAEQAR
ncbi:unnamed protein product, partial [Heterotrigona itama]